MAGTDAEYDNRLRESVRRDKGELEELCRELKEIGEELRREHIRRAKADRGEGTLIGESPVNPMCRKCFNSCKQPATVRIHHCDRFEPVG